MELRQIKELIAAMGRSDLSELSIKEGAFELQLKRQPNTLPGHVILPEPLEGHARTLPTSIEAAPAPTQTLEVDTSRYATAPMVGTFYVAASPDDPPFIKVGDHIEADTVVCIIEAMKVMNEIKAGVSGTVAQILVDNAHPVEFGTKLFRVV